MKRRGFTLIELLVVIAIISLLLAVLLPALSSARSSARKAKCLANMKNMGLALHAYFFTSNDEFPLSQAHGGGQPGWAWLDTLEPYSESKLQYQCPDDRSPRLGHADPALRRVTSYGINIFTSPLQHGWFEGNPLGIPPFGHRSQTRMGAQSANIVFAAEIAEKDAWGNPIVPDHFHPEQWRTNAGQGGAGDDPIFSLQIHRHLRKANYLYADGHAAALRFEQTFLVGSSGIRLEINQYDPGFPHSDAGWYK
ncbi:MAG: prepilin-type N-terminal cleavage/methylation domain-containing protein [Phycisphaerales bacterium]|nr:prepilin-type N-terminal cleavage/methylation domain-containing protein [Phycisphaerales bacterium]